MVLGGIAYVLRQPLILAYIAAGIILGAQGLGLIHDPTYLYDVSSELGIAMLLFVVGLELSIKKMLEVRAVVTFGTLAQSLILVIIGMFAGYFLGFSFLVSVYLGLAIAFASTLLLVKTLGEKHQVDTLHGRIIIGSLVFEDILVIITISVLGVVAGVEPTGFVSWFIGLPGVSLVPYIQNIALVIGALLLLALAYLLNRYIARYLFRFFSHSSEMLFVSALGFLFVIAFAAAELGFSVAIGAFVAGVIVANTDYYLDILGRVKTLATFFALLFFATLGFKVTFDDFTSLIIPILVITAIVVIIKPIVVGFMVRLFGYDKRTSILSGLHMSQISEFSLILMAFGIKFGHVSEEVLTITIMVLLLSFAISMYYMKYSHGITTWLQRRFRSLAPDADFMPEVAIQHATAVVYGVEHLDELFLDRVKKEHGSMVVVDPDPENLGYVRQRQLPIIVGTLSNEEVLEKLPVDKLELVLSTIPDFEENLQVVEHIRKHNARCVIVVSTGRIKEALALYRHGATYVHVASYMHDPVVQQAILHTDIAKLASARKAHVERLTGISMRKHGAVDIEDFLSSLADQHLSAGKRALDKTMPSVSDVDKFIKKMKKK
jgi:Kef-type K+ transport system membrane component KefB/Trk K+ transport system NAD-binding subunit